ncbi:MAG: hypothetical protein R3B93_20380 [Bacteroidia bacterium]
MGRVFNFRVRDSRDYTLRNMAADYDFVNTYQINLLAGEIFVWETIILISQTQYYFGE